MESNQPDEFPDIIDQEASYSLEEFCALCHIDQSVMIQLVEEGIVVANGARPASWTFSFRMVKRLKRAYRLRRDLDLDLPGVALSVELLEQIDQLREELDSLKRRTGFFE